MNRIGLGQELLLLKRRCELNQRAGWRSCGSLSRGEGARAKVKTTKNIGAEAVLLGHHVHWWDYSLHHHHQLQSLEENQGLFLPRCVPPLTSSRRTTTFTLVAS